MNTTELIEIAKGCGGRYAYTNWGYHPFSLTELQQFAQRIEQPLQHKINELRFDVEYQQRQVEELEKHVEQLREALEDALRYKRADEKLVDIINGIGQQQQKPKHGRQA